MMAVAHITPMVLLLVHQLLIALLLLLATVCSASTGRRRRRDIPGFSTLHSSLVHHDRSLAMPAKATVALVVLSLQVRVTRGWRSRSW
eukprot:2026167-Rhodomonas_salina.4